MNDNRLRNTSLDLARFLAFAGMVVVNFRIVVRGRGADPTFGDAMAHALEGRAAALFVILAGFGLGLMAQARPDSFRNTTLKRALFLFVVGLVNTLWFSADILHFYAAYFVIGAFAASWSSRVLWITAAITPVSYVVALSFFDYSTGWNWNTLEYTDLWTPKGFLRHLVLNGWHPVFPWISFLLVGLGLSRIDWSERRTSVKALGIGSLVAVCASLPAALFGDGLEQDTAILLGTSPVPPMPLYVLAGSGTAVAVIGLCGLLLRRFANQPLLRWLSATGRQTLTMYIAHILIGMTVLDLLGLLGRSNGDTAVIASAVMVLFAIVFANLWARRFDRGPLEMVMRRLT